MLSESIIAQDTTKDDVNKKLTTTRKKTLLFDHFLFLTQVNSIYHVFIRAPLY